MGIMERAKGVVCHSTDPGATRLEDRRDVGVDARGSAVASHASRLVVLAPAQ
jgi:hypothetical protein